jgi:hypothetical protein
MEVQNIPLTATLNASKSGTVITGGGSWFHRMIVRGKNEYLYIFMFVLIVCNFQAWLWRVDVISAIVG